MTIARHLITATNDQIESAFSALGYGISADPEYGDDLSYGPAREMDEFRRDRLAWNCPGHIVTDTADALEIQGAQARKGQRRRDVVMIRFGEFVAILGLDT